MHQEKVHFIDFGNLKLQEAQHSLHHFHPSPSRRRRRSRRGHRGVWVRACYFNASRRRRCQSQTRSRKPVLSDPSFSGDVL